MSGAGTRGHRRGGLQLAGRGVLLALLAAGCGGASAAAPYPPEARFVERERLPYTPRPRPHEPGRGPALALTAPDEQARAVARALARALREPDPDALEALLAEHVVELASGLIEPRAAVLERCLRVRRGLSFEPLQRAPTPAHRDALRVRPVAQAGGAAPLPVGLGAQDLRVTLPAWPIGTGSRFPCFREVVVRPSEQPRIVGVLR